MNKAYRGHYRVLANEEIVSGIFELTFESPDIAGATAGQFVNVYLPDGALLLPRPISIADVKGEVVTLVYQIVGDGTRALARFKAGDRVEIMGPLGNGFFDYPNGPADGATDGFADAFTLLLIGGGVGIPPLHFAARRIREARRGRVNIVALLGYREYPWYLKEFEHICNDVRAISETADATATRGNVVDLLNRYHAETENEAYPALALSCGPRPMLAAVSGRCACFGIPLRVSLEERMGCGYGACAGCTCKTRPLADESRPQNGPAFAGEDGIIKKKVCVHGPVFWENEVVW